MRSTWFCTGCQKWHPRSRAIEGDEGGRYWCLHSIQKAIRERRNDIPPQWR